MIRAGVLAADNMAEQIPPRADYGDNDTVNVQFLAACLRLASGFDFTASGTLKHSAQYYSKIGFPF